MLTPRINPLSDLTYKGAFKMPTALSNTEVESGRGMTFYPSRGSLFIIAGNRDTEAARSTWEIIPPSVESLTPHATLANLPRATLQQDSAL